ncbi:hypothetical protein L2231_22220, partial [Xanthomonas perforans]|uniref:hypothetical protein n=1 Tax=Xanthomonas perforans TaxID=442694 RepID=UPI001F404E19
MGLVGVAAHIATRYLIAAINRIRNGRQDVAIARQALVVVLSAVFSQFIVGFLGEMRMTQG